MFGERRDEDTPSVVPLQIESLKFDKSPALILWANVVSSMILKLKLFFEKTIFRQRLRNHQYSSTSFTFELDHTEVISNARRIYILGTSKQLKWGMAFST